MDIKSELKRLKIVPNPLKDQFFLVDENVVNRIVEFADLNGKDIVLEIGAGVGNLTEKMAKKAGKVIAFEIDERFKPILDNLPNNVEIIYDNAWNHIQMGGKYHHEMFYNKVVSNLPYSIIEPYLHNLTFIHYDKAILTIPKRILKFIRKNGIFASFFEVEVLMEIPKKMFYPVPRSNSFVIDLVKLPDPIEERNLARFLRQQMYKHEDQKVKNSLMHALINYAKLVEDKSLTKNRAREIIKKSGIPEKYLDDIPGPKIYDLVGVKILNSYNPIS